MKHYSIDMRDDRGTWVKQASVYCTPQELLYKLMETAALGLWKTLRVREGRTALLSY